MIRYLTSRTTTFKRLWLILFCSLGTAAYAQTNVDTLRGNPQAAGDYYNKSRIVLAPNFSFTATADNSFYAYIAAAYCEPLPASFTSTRNYVLTSVPRVGGMQTTASLAGHGTCELMETVQYLDGLGRPLQTVQVKASPNAANDIVQPYIYDEFGRESTKSLPYVPTTANGSYRTNAIATGVPNFYYPSTSNTSTQQSNGVVNTEYPFLQVGYEPSPENRVIEQGFPGTSWQIPGTPDAGSTNHTVRNSFNTNFQSTFDTGDITASNTGSRRVVLYKAAINSNQSHSLSIDGTYDSNQLYVTITRDENWQPADGCFGTKEEYKDKQGHVVLKRTYNLNASTSLAEMLSTYYVYDNRGNLAFVLPPGANPDAGSAISATTLSTKVYQYRYDDRNRLTQKKIPGKGWEFMVYNALDQVVGTQDSIQRTKATQEWTFTKYDALGRPVTTGLWQHTGKTSGSDQHAAVQTLVDNVSDLWETRLTTGSGNTLIGYNDVAWPLSWETLLKVNYYDNYTPIHDFPSNFDKSDSYSNNTQGLLTASKVLVLNTTSDYLWTVPYYDDKGRVVRSFSQHYYGGTDSLSSYNYDDVSTNYNFTDQPTKIVRHHYIANSAQTAATLSLTVSDSTVYDHIGRVRQQYQQLRNGSAAAQSMVLLAQSDYNEIGQLIVKHLHSIDGGDHFLQNVDYRYNPRGWLSYINTADLTANPLVSTDTNDKFGMAFSYDGSTTATKQYNGNIATIKWRPGAYGSTTPKQQEYDYDYDNIDRLISAKSTSGSTKGLYDENATYNTMGNILTLNRYENISGRKAIDSLTYTYTPGYQLNQVDDKGTTAGFRDTTGVANEYTFDGNGNEKRDMNKRITAIAYNMLNLPQTITKKDGSITAYVYDADGRKLRKINGTGSASSSTEYIDGIQYTGHAIDFIATSEGRARKSGSSYLYEYDLKDHLGNTRVTVNPLPSDASQTTAQVLQENDYYPFGYTIQSLSKPAPGEQNDYLYNGKELQEESGLYDYGRRQYDPMIGRWTSVDPMAEIYQHWTPYNYGADNPIKNTDPDGTVVSNYRFPGLATRYVDPTGRTILNTNDGRDDIFEVPWNMYSLFMNSVNNAGGYGSEPSAVDSKDWNDFWRNSLPEVASQSELNFAGYGYLRSDEAREAQAKYLTTRDISDYQAFLSVQLSDHWSDPVEFVGSIIAFGHGTVGAIEAFNARKVYSVRVRVRGTEDPTSHNFPYSYDNEILKTDPKITKSGYRTYRLKGNMNGKEGVFEIGVNQKGIIDHRFFRPSK